MISICITTHQHERQLEFLGVLLLSIFMQTRIDFEVVVSDDSENDDVRDFCVAKGPPIQWVRNANRGRSSINMNNAINYARGEIIKPMFSDDYFVESDSLSKMVAALDTAHWAFATSTHSNDRVDHVPYTHGTERELALGCNTYGCPSAMIFRRTDVRFDERLIWLMDTECYVRMFRAYGPPAIVDTRIGIREWDGQQTNVAASGHQRLVEAEIVGAIYL